MAYPGTRACCEAVMPVLTEAEMAAWRRESGAKIVCRKGRYWEGRHGGFYQGLHWLARMSAREAVLPTPMCCGYRVALAPGDVHLANGSIPVHLLSDLDSYELESLPRKRRNKLRKCWKNVELVQVTEPTLLREQGYEVCCSVTERLGIWRQPPKDEYQAGLDAYVGDRRRLILAGLIGDRLAGYIEAQAIDGVAYVERVYLATEALPSEIGTGLVYELVQACRRSGEVRELVYGWGYPHNETLRVFKFAMGFPVVDVPSRVWMLPFVGPYIRRRLPDKYYWLTGRR